VMRTPRRLPRAAREMLAIVAQYQPLTRAEIEQIHGASLSQATINLLLEAGLIGPKGVKNAPRRPTLWVTTPAFLTHFGLCRTPFTASADSFTASVNSLPHHGRSSAATPHGGGRSPGCAEQVSRAFALLLRRFAQAGRIK